MGKEIKEIIDGLQPFGIVTLQNLLYGIQTIKLDANGLDPIHKKLAECVIAVTESRDNLRWVFPDLDTPDKVTDEFWGFCMEARQMALELLKS